MLSNEKPERLGALVFIPIILSFLAAAGVVYCLIELGHALHGVQVTMVRQ